MSTACRMQPAMQAYVLSTQGWNADLFEPLKAAGGRAYSNYAVGYNNVNVPSATEWGIAVGNTPGVIRTAGRTCDDTQVYMLAVERVLRTFMWSCEIKVPTLLMCTVKPI